MPFSRPGKLGKNGVIEQCLRKFENFLVVANRNSAEGVERKKGWSDDSNRISLC